MYVAFIVEITSKQARVFRLSREIHVNTYFLIKVFRATTECGGEEEGVLDGEHGNQAFVGVHVSVFEDDSEEIFVGAAHVTDGFDVPSEEAGQH